MIELATTPIQREIVVKWMAAQTDQDAYDIIGGSHFEVFAVLRRDTVRGGVLFTCFRSGDAEMVIVGAGPDWITRGDLRALFTQAYSLFKLRRVTAIVHRKHKRSRKFCERIGFRLEGVKRQGMNDGADACHYGMTRKECRWIDHGIFRQADAA